MGQAWSELSRGLTLARPRAHHGCATDEASGGWHVARPC
jgi:hypothetical protein